MHSVSEDQGCYSWGVAPDLQSFPPYEWPADNWPEDRENEIKTKYIHQMFLIFVVVVVNA